jgi:hypothetical protein
VSDSIPSRAHDALADGDPAAAAVPDRCAHCRRPLETEESSLVLMRDGRPVAAYHERCHPHYRRSGCSAC